MILQIVVDRGNKLANIIYRLYNGVVGVEVCFLEIQKLAIAWAERIFAELEE